MKHTKKHFTFPRVLLIVFCLTIFWFFALLQPTPLAKLLSLGSALFAIGLYGVLSSHSILKTLISLEILFNVININLIAFSKYTDLVFVRGQIFALFVMAIAAAEAALGLALAINIYRQQSSNSLAELTELKG